MKDPIKVLLAEDESSLGLIIKESLESRGFSVQLCEDGDKAKKSFLNDKPKVVVLDVMMPKLDGFSLAREIRKVDESIPIIFLTAKTRTQDVVEGFKNGANDYLKKPFSMEELIVRIHALINRNPNPREEVTSVGSYTFDRSKQLLFHKRSKVEIQLTHRETELLYLLLQRKNELAERKLILNMLWDNDDFFSARSMDVFITKLRKKLAKDENISIINVRGYGYKLVC